MFYAIFKLKINVYNICKELTIADYVVFAYLRDNAKWNDENSGKYLALNRWFGHISHLEPVKSAKLAPPAMTGAQGKEKVKMTDAGRKQEGTFIELPGAEMGKGNYMQKFFIKTAHFM